MLVGEEIHNNANLLLTLRSQFSTIQKCLSTIFIFAVLSQILLKYSRLNIFKGFEVLILSNSLRFIFLQRLNLSFVFFFLLLSPFVATLFLSALFVGDIKAFLDSRLYTEAEFLI